MSWPLQGIVASKKWGTTTRRLMALTLSSVANDDGSGIYASVKTMARDSEISESTARRTLQEFEEAGIIRKVGERKCLNGYTNVYEMVVARVSALDDLKPAKSALADTGVRVKGVSAEDPCHHDTRPLSPRHQTPVTVTDNPILEPILEPILPLTGVGESPKGKSSRSRKNYTPEFEAIWLSWPSHRRANSDKQMAFKRYLSGTDQFGHEAIRAAAKRYLALPETRKENFRFCCLVEVFMNGKLEAAVEAARDVPHGTNANTISQALWAEGLSMWRERRQWISDLGPNPDHASYRGPDPFARAR